MPAAPVYALGPGAIDVASAEFCLLGHVPVVLPSACSIGAPPWLIRSLSKKGNLPAVLSRHRIAAGRGSFVG